MSARPSSATSSKARARGFTLPEVLVCAAIAGIVTLAASSGYVFMTKSWVQQQARLQTQQQLRSAVAAVTREMRVAGACMDVETGIVPPTDFQPLSGIDNGTTDSITIRANPHCAKATSTAPCVNTCTSFTVDNTTFAGLGGTWGYLYYHNAPNPPVHAYFKILSVAGGTISVDPSQPFTGTFPPGTSVFGVEERTFAISSTCPTCGGVPSLTLLARGGQVEALVKGIDLFNIQYVLNDDYDAVNCVGTTGGGRPLCVVNLPQSAANWKKVRLVAFDVGARSLRAVGGAGSADGFLHHDEIFQISPRNFQFPAGRL